MADCGATVPLTEFQHELLALLARTRDSDGYLAGGILPRVVDAER